MSLNLALRSTKSLPIAVLVACLAGLATGYMAWQLIEAERRSGAEDLERRSSLLALRLTPVATQALELPEADVPGVLGHRLDGHGQLEGLALLRKDGSVLAANPELGEFFESLRPALRSELDRRMLAGRFLRQGARHVYVHVQPLATGSIVVIHDASYLDERATHGLLRAAFWVMIVVLGVTVAIVGLSWLVYDGPLRRLAAWMKELRMGDPSVAPPGGMPVLTLFEESQHLAASFRAARTSNWMKSRDVVKHDKVWTKERLAAHATHCLGHDPLVVLSNREPYMHQLKDGRITAIVPASGMVTALEPVLEACGGLWVAHGSGSGDRESSDSKGRLSVPPGDPRYTLKRVWLTPELEKGYYYGFSNEGLWPLCHLAHERPVFRAADWEHYVGANRQFAEAALDEIGSGNAMVWIQDYHLALVPRMLRERRPELRIGIFWHVPWPTAESFNTCPWGREIVEGMLGADVVGFHLQQHCNNFLDTVDRVVEAKLDWDHFAAELGGRRSLVRPFPISVQGWAERDVPKNAELEAQVKDLRERHAIRGSVLGVGVDRVDYTKGLPERFRAVRRLLEKHPEHRGKFTFVQLGAPSRTDIKRYRDLGTELQALADSINAEFGADGWQPIRLLVAHHDASTVHAFLSMASMCVVSSLHDGMNLVAKEFVSARTRGDGVLVLSQFAGASRELAEALIVNPYDEEAFADALHAGLVMDAAEQARRMTSMRRAVEENNVYAWAAGFLTELSQGRKSPAPTPTPTPVPAD